MTGATGKPGTDGKIYYTWIKYSNGTAASMSDDPSGKTHIGIAYNKTTMVESNTYSDYAWSLIKGEDGEPGYTPVKGKDYFDGEKGDKGDKGDDGTDATNIKTIKTQYYLSTSKTSATGGSWSDTQQTWTSGKYFWIRDVIVWDTNPETTTTTTGVLAASLNQANETANTANSTANTANTNASNAVSTANTANSTANTAKTTAENASSKADTATSTANTASSKADAASTAASNAATAASNADKKAEEAKTAAGTAQTTANQAKTAASNAETKANAAKEAIDNLEIGGRNLLLGTKNIPTQKAKTYRSWFVRQSDQYVENYYNDFTAAHETATWGGIGFYLNAIKDMIAVGDKITFSCEVENKAATAISLSLFLMQYNSSGSRVYEATDASRTLAAIAVDEKKKVSVTWTVEQSMFDLIDAGGRCEFTMQCSTTLNDTNRGEGFYLYAPKLEFGNIVTDWTPAPEDTQTDIDNAVSTAIKGTTLYYTATTSRSELPNTSTDSIWEESVTDLGDTANKYIWSKTRVTFMDNTYKDSIPTFLYQDVKTLDKIVLWYATADNVSVAPTEGWSTEPPGSTELYIWTKTVSYYTDGTDNFNTAAAVCDTTIATLQEGITEKGKEIFSSLQDKGFVRIFEDKIFLLNNKEVNQVTQAICMNNSGIAFAKASEGSYLTWDEAQQTFTDAFTSVWGIEGTFDLLGLNVLNIKAENIQDGTLTLGKDKNQSGHLEIFGANETSPTVMANGDGIIISLNNGGEIRLSEAEGLVVTSGNASNKEYGSYQDGKGFESNQLRANNEMDFGSVIAAKPMTITTADGVTHTGVDFIKIIS